MQNANDYIAPVDPEHVQFLTILQLTLENYYDINPPYSIGEFVCHSAQTNSGIADCKGHSPEMLVYRESDTNLDISLFLNPSLLNNIQLHTYKQCWPNEIFNCGCIMLEGVSHFLYTVHNAHHDRQVSLLDLEIQAEIDKFVFAALATHCGKDIQSLIARLFCDVSYRNGLSDKLLFRYRQANELAFHYCQWLQQNFVLTNTNKFLLAELGTLYRLNGTAKQEHIRRIIEPLREAG